MKIKDSFNNFISEIKKDKVVLFFIIILLTLVVLIVVLSVGNSREDSDTNDLKQGSESSSNNSNVIEDTDFGINQSLNFDSILPFSSGTFDIDKDYINNEYDLIITVSDEERAMSDFNEWMDSVGQDPEGINLSITTLDDQVSTQSILDLLPVETSTYRISYSVRTEQIVADIIDSDYSRGKSAVEAWFNSQGIDDVSILNVVWIDRSSM